MGSPLATLCLLGALATSCLGEKEAKRGEPVSTVRLNGSNSKCQGWVEVRLQDKWYPVSEQSWEQRKDSWRFNALCQKLHCGHALSFGKLSNLQSSQEEHVTCHGMTSSFSNCTFNLVHQRDSLGLVCLEPKKTTLPPTTPPPTPTPEPTAPPRFQLLPGPKGLQCAGWVAFYHGKLGGMVSSQDQEGSHRLLNIICETLQCGSFLSLLDTEENRAQGPWESAALPILWKIKNSSCGVLEQCFQKVLPKKGGPALAIVCSGFQPKVQSRLVDGGGLCAGAVEVRQRGGWVSLCEDRWALRSSERWEEVCRQQQCGPLLSQRLLDSDSAARQGFTCVHTNLSHCHHLQDKRSRCKRAFVTCQDPNPAGLGAGTVMSIILGLVLLAVLLVLCGPPAYKKLVKKYRQKKQRQWIGPTEMSQNMSFHRNHTATTVRVQTENPPTMHAAENEYSQPPRNSQASAYPALEGALRRVSTQPDNSSDSDYDLHSTQRL